MEKEIKQQGQGMSRRKFLGNAAALSAFMIVPRHVLGGKGFIAPSDRINLGFIGSGRQSLTLQKAFLPLAEGRIIAACDVYQSKVDNFSHLVNDYYAAQNDQSGYKGCTTYQRFTDLLENKDIDAVVIATPDHWHAAMTDRAAAAGKDIYSEKPLSLTVAEGRAMVNAVRKHKRVFQTGSMQRSRPEFRQAAELIRNGYIGDIKNVKVSIGGPPVPYDLPEETLPNDLDWQLWLGPNEYVHYNHQLNPVIGDATWGRWRDFKGLGGGDITDWGAHMFDIVQWALDMDNTGPVSITPPDGRDLQHLTMVYSNGITVTHENWGRPHGIQFNGTQGVIEIQRNKLVTTPETLKEKVIGSNEKQVYHSSNHYLDFLQAIKGRTKPIADVETGHRSATVCNLANIAYELNAPLQWNPEKEQITNNAAANNLLSRKMKKEWAV
ncbi:Gfo/Idh/MocA family oxidoreductase [Chitinophaga agrisoli]|uniref:Gfo/Idh/MocA family oxidoreductase n=1 Tax=Chitinophaga agrisoli TaxID=2607653 RepID=A0A5B2VK82_9BACT|nr:Gfo/Idh/MocA family oxidoreductase [Chitinophaga agrisoli]KAA2239000.1 Gfo/Idh/MocA family oxidoreductase [Chitinophaga agrisoli]